MRAAGFDGRVRIQALALVLVCGLGLMPLHAEAQGESRKPLPITTGTSTTAMDAPDTNNDLESYTHSPVVAAVAKRLGLSTNRASRYFEDFNSGVLILVVLYFFGKLVPARLRDKRKGIDHDLLRARQATADAAARLQRIEGRLNSLDGEVEVLRQQAAETSRAEEQRIHASLEEERQRIVRSAETEVAAAQAAAERGLKQYAANLAVDRAAERVRVTPEADAALIDEFLQGLERQLAGAPPEPSSHERNTGEEHR